MSTNSNSRPYFKSGELAYGHLRKDVFPEMSKFFRLYKANLSRQDEYILIKPFWPSEAESFTPRTYRTDRDINDMMLAANWPTTVMFHTENDNDRLVLRKDGVLAAWRREPQTQWERITGLCYVPGGAEVIDGMLNTFKDVSVPRVQPPLGDTSNLEAMSEEGGLKDILDHLKFNICNANEGYYLYLLQWLAHMVQKPAERPGTGIAIIGDQGTGKGIFIEFLKRMLGGPRNANTTASSTDTKAFNSSLGCKLLVVFDEATFAGDRQQSDFMKKLVTEPRIRIEQKGLDAYEVDNFARVLITSNNMTSAVPADVGARRWLIMECKGQISSSYLTDLRIKIGNAGDVDGAIPNYANMFKWFLNAINISDFDPVQLPMQDSGFATKLQGTYKTEPVKAFLWDWLMAEDLTFYRAKRIRDGDKGMVDVDEPMYWDKEVLFSDFYAIMNDLVVSAYGTMPARNHIGRLLEEFGLKVVSRGGNVRYLSMQHPKVVLAQLRKTSRFDNPISKEQQAVIDTAWRAKTDDRFGTMIMNFKSDEEKAESDARQIERDLKQSADTMKKFDASPLGHALHTGEHVSDGELGGATTWVDGFAAFGSFQKKPKG